METVGKRIAQRRKELKLSQKKLAADVGVNRVTLTNWELGKLNPEPANILKLSSALKVDAVWLFSGKRVLEFSSDDLRICREFFSETMRSLKMAERAFDALGLEKTIQKKGADGKVFIQDEQTLNKIFAVRKLIERSYGSMMTLTDWLTPGISSDNTFEQSIDQRF